MSHTIPSPPLQDPVLPPAVTTASTSVLDADGDTNMSTDDASATVPVVVAAFPPPPPAAPAVETAPAVEASPEVNDEPADVDA